jgi:hypothetical protein
VGWAETGTAEARWRDALVCPPPEEGLPLGYSSYTQRGLLRPLTVSLVGLLGVIGSLATSFVVAEPAGAATTLFVSASGSDADNSQCSVSAPCATITHALSVAGTGGVTIEVAGTIDDNVSVSSTVTVEQWPGQAPAKVDGRGRGLGSVFYVSIQGGNLILNGLTVTGGNSDLGGGIDNNDTATVTDSTITNNAGGGIANNANLTVTDSTIANNSRRVRVLVASATSSHLS